MKNARGIAVLMFFQGIINIGISALVLSHGVVPAPTGFWYLCTGPLALASGIVAILAAGRNLRLESRWLGFVALGLLGASGLGTYKVPSGLIICVAGTYLYLQKSTKDAFAGRSGAAGSTGGRSVEA